MGSGTARLFTRAVGAFQHDTLHTYCTVWHIQFTLVPPRLRGSLTCSPRVSRPARHGPVEHHSCIVASAASAVSVRAEWTAVDDDDDDDDEVCLHSANPSSGFLQFTAIQEYPHGGLQAFENPPPSNQNALNKDC